MKELTRIATAIGIVVAVSLIAVGVYELAPRPSVRSNVCVSGLSTNQPGAPPLAFSESVDSIKGLNHWYNFTVISASTTLTFGSLSFEVKTPEGAIADLTPGSGVSVVKTGGLVEATFALGGGWTYEPGFDSTTVLSSQDLLSLFYYGAAPSSIVGYDFFALFCQGIGSAPIS